MVAAAYTYTFSHELYYITTQNSNSIEMIFFLFSYFPFVIFYFRPKGVKIFDIQKTAGEHEISA